jgi:hypothetical protein
MKLNTKPPVVAQSALIALVVAVVAVAAGHFWTDKPYTDWSKREANKMLTDSPWAKTQTYTVKIPGQGTGIAGEKEIFDKFVVRFYSALPVRQAFVRTAEFNQKSGKMSEEQEQAFAKQTDRMLTAKYPDHIILSMYFESNAQGRNLDITRYLWTRPKEAFKNTIFLITDRKDKVEIVDYFPPSADGTGAKFIFPRQKDGRPLVTPGDKEAKVQFLLSRALRGILSDEAGDQPPRGSGGQTQRGIGAQAPGFNLPDVFITFKVKDMMLNGELVL